MEKLHKLWKIREIASLPGGPETNLARGEQDNIRNATLDTEYTEKIGSHQNSEFLIIIFLLHFLNILLQPYSKMDEITFLIDILQTTPNNNNVKKIETCKFIKNEKN